MNLFLDQEPAPFSFEKNAAEVTLPEDPNQWTNEILQELYKQVSYISDFNTHVVLDRVDAEKGYAFGHVLVSSKSESPAGAPPQQEQAAGIQQARIPIIVKERKLQPFDVLVTASSKMLPLTEQRVRQALFRPQIFDVTSKTPGDISMIGQLYPPYRQNYGFGGGGAVVNMGMGKTGEAKQARSRSETIKQQQLHKTGGVKQAGRVEAARQAMANAWQRLRGGAQAAVQPLHDVAALPGEMRGAIKNVGHAIENQNAALVRMQQLGEANAARLGEVGRNVAIGGTLLGAGTMTGVGLGALGLHRANQNEAMLRQMQQQQGEPMKVGSVLGTILPTISERDYLELAGQLQDPDVKLAFLRNEPAAQVLDRLSHYRPVDREKRATALARSLRYDTAQVTREGPGQYRLKVASHGMWAPITRSIDRGELVGLMGAKLAVAVDQQGSVTVADGADVGQGSPESSHAEAIKDFGLYRVETKDGRKLVGFVFPNLLDVDGTSLPLALFTNGSEYSMQSDICGVRAGEGQAIPEAGPHGKGAYFRVLPNGKAEATVPLDIQASLDNQGDVQFMATSFAGQRVRLVPHPAVKSLTAAPGGAILVPGDMRWLTLEGAKEVELCEQPDLFGSKQASARRAIEIEIRSGGQDCFSLSGLPVEKLGYQQTQQLSLDDAAFVLAGYGIQPEYAFQKLGESLHAGRPIAVPIGRMVKTASERYAEATQTGQQILEMLPQLKQPFLVKEAATIPDTTAVDTVLSLGFLNPENMLEFLKAMPVLDDAQSRMCELLIAARLGLKEVPTGALEKAIKATENVIEGLRVIAFQEN